MKLELKKYYKDDHLIHCKLTGICPSDLNEEEDGLMNDSEKFPSEYNKHLAKILRENFINLHDILYQLLKQRGIVIPHDGQMRIRTAYIK